MWISQPRQGALKERLFPTLPRRASDILIRARHNAPACARRRPEGSLQFSFLEGHVGKSGRLSGPWARESRWSPFEEGVDALAELISRGTFDEGRPLPIELAVEVGDAGHLYQRLDTGDRSRCTLGQTLRDIDRMLRKASSTCAQPSPMPEPREESTEASSSSLLKLSIRSTELSRQDKPRFSSKQRT